ncbi:MAG: class F sortase [Dehalococcoidia bacterium]
MDSSGARRIQMALFFIIGIAALAAVFLLASGGGDGGIRLFASTQSRQTTLGSGRVGEGTVSDGKTAPARQADSVAAFTKKYGDPPDATYGRIRIPSISVNAPLSYRAVTGSEMPEPSGPTDVAYYDMAKFPGMGGVPGGGGNSILAGHVDLRRPVAYAGNVEYQGPAVFWSLDKLRAGDIIEIDYKGKTYKYAVTAANEYNAESADWGKVWSSEVKKETLTLFTCGGTFNPETHEYSTRLVVRAERS